MLKSSIRDLHSPLKILDHEFVHIINSNVEDQERLILRKTELELLGSPNFAGTDLLVLYQNLDPVKEKEITDKMGEYYRSETLEGIYGLQSNSIYATLSEDYMFRKLLSKATIILNFEGNGPISGEIEFLLKTKANEKETPLEMRQYASLLLERLNKIVKQKTGLYPYSFYDRNREFSSTYSELSLEQARRHPKLAQLELDKVYSLRKPVPEWLKTKAEERYYAILGGKNGKYCIKNQCGPCKIYTLSCAV